MGKWKILGIVDEGVNDDIYILLEYWGFHGRNVDKFWVCLSGLLRILLNLIRRLVFLGILFLILVHFMLDLIILLFGMTCVFLLIIILLHFFMHTMLNLIHPYL